MPASETGWDGPENLPVSLFPGMLVLLAGTDLQVLQKPS